ncbi:uncharacterized protein LOC106139611 isoform X2 [Amyelois transitella]|nr:uncharacterized protein LOC106139611 isoform X2 [Amyelois transitella]
MIGRPDLLQKPHLKPECHFVCHIHFEEYMMIRKPLLRPNAIPTKNIPTLPILNEPVEVTSTKADKATQTKKNIYKNLVNCKRKGVSKEEKEMTPESGDSFLYGESGKKKRKIKAKKKLRSIESEQKQNKSEEEDEEHRRKQWDAAKGDTTDAPLSPLNLVKTIKTEPLDVSRDSTYCSPEDNNDMQRTVLVEIEIKKEIEDD